MSHNVHGKWQSTTGSILHSESPKYERTIRTLTTHCMIMIYRIVSEKDLYLVILLNQKKTTIKPKLPGVTTSPRQNTLQMSL